MDAFAAVNNIYQIKPVDIAYPAILRGRVRAAVESWRIFCDLPKEIKSQFVYTESQMQDGSGYELKEQQGATLDRKENFHVTLNDINRFFVDESKLKIAESVNFINDSERLVNFLTPTIKEFVGRLEENLSLSGLEAEVMDGRRSWILRYIHYFGGCNVGDQIAAPHADKSGFTLHLFESEPGLEYLDYCTSWQPMPVFEGRTAMIPGMQLQFASQNLAKAVCHRVIATETAARFGRYSAVLFVPLCNTKVYNKNAAGRTQDLAPGFNYDMAWEEFQKLFI